MRSDAQVVEPQSAEAAWVEERVAVVMVAATAVVVKAVVRVVAVMVVEMVVERVGRG